LLKKLNKEADKSDLLQRKNKNLSKEIDGNEEKMVILNQKAKIAEALNEENKKAEEEIFR
jgi:hypothetical protein